MRPPSTLHLLGAFALATLVARPMPAAALLPTPHNPLVVADSADFVTLQWEAVDDSALVGYRVLVSETPGVHPLQTSWNGYPAALSWTTDDSRPDNMVWAQVAAQFGYTFTVFTISGRLGQPGFLTVSQLNALHAAGHEIAAHSVNHPVLTTDAAIRLRYVGPGPDCTVSVNGGVLTTYVGSTPDAFVNLTNPSVYYLNDLAAYLDGLPDYECTFENYAVNSESSESRWLDPIPLPGEPIKSASYLLTTQKGCSAEELASEVGGAKAALESAITDPSFACRTFSYPFHMHDQREMNAVMAAGYLGARAGYYGTHPIGAPVDADTPNRVDSYEKLETYLGWSNASPEPVMRSAVRSYLATIKSLGDWGHPRTVHFLSDVDSLHLTWLFDELQDDGQVWVAPFGEVAAYARQFGIRVGKPNVVGSSPALCRVKLGGFDRVAAHYAVVVAYDAYGQPSAWSKEVVWGGGTVVGTPGSAGDNASAAPIALASWPNPTRKRSHFAFALAGAADVRLALYDASGRLVRRLVDRRLEAGPHEAVWDGADESGRRVPSGVYLYELDAAAASPSRGKIQVLR